MASGIAAIETFVTRFQQDAKSHVRRLTQTGQPELLTVNSKPAVIVQNARSYQRLLDTVDNAEAFAGITLGLDSLARGKGQSARTVFSRLPRECKISPGV